jgi:hypothetical protein
LLSAVILSVAKDLAAPPLKLRNVRLRACWILLSDCTKFFASGDLLLGNSAKK